MGTNYYFRHCEKLIQISYLKKLKTIGSEPYSDDWIHLGKKSMGWRFCWNPNVGVKKRGAKIIVTYIYPLSRKGIEAFILQDKIEIFDEYGGWVDKKDFLEMAFSEEGVTGDTYAGLESGPLTMFSQQERQKDWKRLGYSFKNDYSYDFEVDGLIFSTTTEFS